MEHIAKYLKFIFVEYRKYLGILLCFACYLIFFVILVGDSLVSWRSLAWQSLQKPLRDVHRVTKRWLKTYVINIIDKKSNYLLTSVSIIPFLDCLSIFKYPNTSKVSSSSASSKFASMDKNTPDLPPPSLEKM